MVSGSGQEATSSILKLDSNCNATMAQMLNSAEHENYPAIKY